MKSFLHFAWWLGILAATWETSNASNGVFHSALPSSTTNKAASGHRTKKGKSFSSIFVEDSFSTGVTGSGFQPLGKKSIESQDDGSTPSPTVATEARRKGESKAPKSSPTQSPTAYTTLSAIDDKDDDEAEEAGQGISRPTLQKATVVAEPRTIQLKGDFDPQVSEQTIFQATESLMRTYMNTYGGSVMESFELSLIFFHEYDHYQSVDGHPLMTMYFDVDVVFYVASYEMDDIAAFSRSKATKLVDRFFSGTHLTRLKRRLSAKGLKIKDAQLFTALPENIPKSETGDKYQPFVSPSEGNKSSENTVLYAALASGAIMFFALVCVVVISRREFRKNVKTVMGSLITGSKQSSSSSSSSVASTVSGGIKPAALHMRRKREEEQARQMETSSLDGFSYSDKSFGSNFVRAHQPFLHISRLGAKPRESNFVIDDDDDDESLDRLEDGLVASGALTCLDQERSEISKEYPEFELFAHIPRQILESKPKLPVHPSSPVWSVSATSYDVSAAGDEDYAEQRRRWQDQQLEDLALVLPDHFSDREGPSESDASTGSSSEKSCDDHSNSTRNSSSASVSRDVPAGLRREDDI